VGLALVAGALCGLVLLLPLSRLSTRAAVVPCLVLGCFLLAAAALRSPPAPASIVPAALAAGYVIARFLPDPARVLEPLRDLSVPCAVGWAILTAAGLQGSLQSIAIPAAALMGARAMGLLVAGRIVPNPLGRAGLAGLAAQLPTTAAITVLPALALLADETRAALLVTVLAWVTVGTQAIGLVGLRRALARAGEVPSPDNPDAWRERMR
jgi:hypothetical protein